VTRKIIGHAPTVKTRALQWQKLNASSIQRTIWGVVNVDEKALEEELDIAGVFAAAESTFAQKVIATRAKARKERKQEITIINPKKAHNISKNSYSRCMTMMSCRCRLNPIINRYRLVDKVQALVV
jgi:cytokinesis protein